MTSVSKKMGFLNKAYTKQKDLFVHHTTKCSLQQATNKALTFST